jgi:ferritin-like protein
VTERSGSTPAHRITRSRLLRAAASASIIGGGVSAYTALADAASSTAMGVRVFRFALLLERLQEAMYRHALVHGVRHGDLEAFVATAYRHERAHVRYLERALGPAAPAPPRFQFGSIAKSPSRFAAAAIEVEELAVAAYNGQGTNLSPAALARAARIVSVEARHAGWLRDVAGVPPAPHPVDDAISAREAVDRLKRMRFVVGLR